MDDPSRKGKNVHAGDAYFCCPKSEETGLLDLGVTGTGLKDGLPTATPGDQTRIISIKMTNWTQKDFFWVRFVYSLGPLPCATVFLCMALLIDDVDILLLIGVKGGDSIGKGSAERLRTFMLPKNECVGKQSLSCDQNVVLVSITPVTKSNTTLKQSQVNKNGEGMEGWEEDNKERVQPDV